jgi:hypothetical protein
VPRELRRRQVHSTLDAQITYSFYHCLSRDMRWFLSIMSRAIAYIKEYLLLLKMWVRVMVSKKERYFQNVYDEGLSPLSPTECDD